MQVKRAQKANGIKDRRIKTSPFEREGTDFIISRWRNKTPGAGPGSEQIKILIGLSGGLPSIAYNYKYRFSIVI